MQRRGATKVHQHHRRAMGAKGEGGNGDIGFEYGSYNYIMHGHGNATLPTNKFTRGGWIRIVRRTFHQEMIPIILYIKVTLSIATKSAYHSYTA